MRCSFFHKQYIFKIYKNCSSLSKCPDIQLWQHRSTKMGISQEGEIDDPYGDYLGLLPLLHVLVNLDEKNGHIWVIL